MQATPRPLTARLARGKPAAAIAVFFTWTLASTSAFAQSPDGAAGPGTSPADRPISPVASPAEKPAIGSDAAQTKKTKKSKDSSIEIGGRVFVRDTVFRPGWLHELAVDSARLGVEYELPERGLKVEVDAEIAGRQAEIRDGYIRVAPSEFLRFQAGRFKRPISAIALASRWSLPTIERGVVSDLELNIATTSEPDRLPLGGRAEGVTAQVRLRDVVLEPTLTLGVFRGEVNEQLAEASVAAPLITLSDGFPEDVYGRLEVEPMKRVRIAASMGWFAYLGEGTTRDTLKHGLVGGIDIIAELKRIPLRLWFEAYTGTSPLHFGVALSADGRFYALRTIASVPLEIDSWGLAGRGITVEPHISGQIVDASSERVEDRAVQVSGGVNLVFGKNWRIQLEADHLDAGFRLSVVEGTRFMAQLGAVLK